MVLVPALLSISIYNLTLCPPSTSFWSRSSTPPQSSPGTLTCAKATWCSTSSTPSGPHSLHAKTPWPPTASPPQWATMYSSSISPGRWGKITAWWSPRSHAGRERACRWVQGAGTDRLPVPAFWCVWFNLLGLFWRCHRSPQGSHITRWPGFYILQWKFHNMPACSATNLPRVDDVLATLQVSSHKCKVMFYTEVLGSEDFRLVTECLWVRDKWIRSHLCNICDARVRPCFCCEVFYHNVIFYFQTLFLHDFSFFTPFFFLFSSSATYRIDI